MIVNLFKRFRYICNQLRSGSLPLGIISEKNKMTVVLFFFCIPEWQTSFAKVMAYLKSLNKLLITRIYIAAEKWMVTSTGVGGFITFIMYLYQPNCLFKEDMK